MTLKPPPRNILPRPPDEYTTEYMNRLLQLLQDAIDRFDNPSLIRGGSLYLSGCPSSGNELKPGSVFQDLGTLKVVRTGDNFVDSSATTVSVGSVTVTS